MDKLDENLILHEFIKVLNEDQNNDQTNGQIRRKSNLI